MRHRLTWFLVRFNSGRHQNKKEMKKGSRKLRKKKRSGLGHTGVVGPAHGGNDISGKAQRAIFIHSEHCTELEGRESSRRPHTLSFLCTDNYIGNLDQDLSQKELTVGFHVFYVV